MKFNREHEDEMDRPYENSDKLESEELRKDKEINRKIKASNFKHAQILLYICIVSLLAMFIANFFWIPKNNSEIQNITEIFKTVLFTLIGYLYNLF